MNNFFEDFFSKNLGKKSFDPVGKTVIVCEGCDKKIRITYGKAQRCPHCKTVLTEREVENIFNNEGSWE